MKNCGLDSLPSLAFMLPVHHVRLASASVE